MIPFDTEEEAIEIANDTEYGLGAGVWTKDLQRAHRVAHAIRAGAVWVNSYRMITYNVPFGGYKQSGLGRENGLAAVLAQGRNGNGTDPTGPDADSVGDRRGMPQGRCAVIPLIETPRGVLAMSEMCARLPGRVARFAFGSGDYTAEMGVPWTPDSAATSTARDLLAMHSQAAGLPPPIDGPYLDIHDLEGLRQDTVNSLARGFTGRIVVYPKQVPVVQTVYGGVLDDVGFARGLVDAFEAAVKEGLASLQYEGKFVDYAVYRDVKGRLEREES